MTSHSPEAAANKPLVLSSAEIDQLLSMTLIANLATLDDDRGIHLLPMWFMRVGNDICIPTSHHTHKYRNLQARPRASVMIDVSKAGLRGGIDQGPGTIRGWKRGSGDQPFDSLEVLNAGRAE
jgi:hypothetical protein